MRKLLLSICAALLFAAHAHAQLLQQSDLEYLGAFKLPTGTQRCGSFTDVSNCFFYAGQAIAFNPANGSLFYSAHDWHPNFVAEIAIPPIINTTTFSQLNAATVIQPFADAFDGKFNLIGSGTIKTGGIIVANGNLSLTAYIYYDAANTQTLSHYSRPLTLSITGQTIGPVAVGPFVKSGFVSGYMTPIPQAWQTALGGTHLTGNCCLSIISRTSYGPAAFAFNPADIGNVSPVPSQPLIYYDSTHQTLGACGVISTLFNCSTEIHGVVFPEGSNSVLFFGRQGIGPYCYGTGAVCNDPVYGAQGVHAYPYVYQVWAYDAAELAKVKQGIKQPWEVLPYTTWQLSLPFGLGHGLLGGATYDPQTHRLFLVQRYALSGGTDAVHVFNVNIPPPPVIEADFTITTKEGRTITISRQPTSPATNAVLVVDPSMNVIVNGEVK